MKKVVIYGRVSTFSQDVDRQIEELKSLCESRNYEIVKIFTETISGVKSRKQRKEISQLLEFIKSTKDICGVLVWELSRLGRRTEDVLEIINELSELKIWVYSKKENLLTLNEDGTESSTAKLTLTVLSGVATLERETILSRSASGMKKAVNDGNWLGGKFLPYGYKRENKKLVVDEDESEVIKMIFDLYLKGFGTHKIAKELNSRGIPTRYNKAVNNPIVINHIVKNKDDFKWKDGTVYGILTNPTYIGKKEGKGLIEGLKLNSPPIVNEDDFLKVKDKLKTSQRRKTKKFFYLFEKKLICGVCGKSFHPHKRENNKDNRYVCLSKRYGIQCDSYGISIPKLHDSVWSILRHNPREIERILAENNHSESLNSEIELLEKTKRDYNQEIQIIERKEKNLVDLLLDNKIDRNVYNGKYIILAEDKRRINEELTNCIGELNLKINQREKQSNAGFQLRSIKDNKNILKRVVNNVIIKIKIYPIFEHNLQDFLRVNKQDKFLFFEVFTYLNDKIPLCFIISQRSNSILIPQPIEFDKQNKILEIGKGKTNFVEEEGDEDIIVREIFHLESLE